MLHLQAKCECEFKMKTIQFVYLTAVFSLGINTIITTLFPQFSYAATKKYGNLPLNNIATITLDRDAVKQDGIHSLSQTQKPQMLIARETYYGKASWYGPKFHGRTTANGETFNSYGLTAAHRSLPFGTKVKVTNLRNGRSVIVRINDRGPFIKGRIIDLSTGAAQKLNMVGSGLANVQIDILGR